MNYAAQCRSYAYVDLGGADLGLFRVGGPGLGNLLFPWARALVASKRFGLKVIWPTWFQVKLGPLLRGEADLRSYGRLFRRTPQYAALPEGALARLLLPCKCETDLLCEERLGSAVYVFRGLADYFSSLSGHSSLLRDALASMSTQQLSCSSGPHVALHVRLGDFAPAADAATGHVSNTRVPMSWYREAILMVQERLALPVLLYSDGRDSELQPLLAMTGVHRRKSSASALVDLWDMANATALIASGSTFSMWAAYLGNVPALWPPRRPMLASGCSYLFDPDGGDVSEIASAFFARLRERCPPEGIVVR